MTMTRINPVTQADYDALAARVAALENAPAKLPYRDITITPSYGKTDSALYDKIHEQLGNTACAFTVHNGWVSGGLHLDTDANYYNILLINYNDVYWASHYSSSGWVIKQIVTRW
jgi:hypothetical protein